MTRRAITSSGAASVGPYSQAIDTGNLIFLSGQTPIDSTTGRLVEGDIGTQTRQCLTNLSAVLEAAGLTTDDVVKCNVYLTDMANFAGMNAVYETFFTAPFPARTTVQVAGLPLGAEVEIEMVALKK